jgi:hypothetical protein
MLSGLACAGGAPWMVAMLLLISMIKARDMTTNRCMFESPHFEIDVGDKHHCLSRASEKID